MTKFLKNADVTGYISQTSVTSSLVKTDVDGKLVAAIAGTDYNAPGVSASAGTLIREIRNTTGATLTKGTIVYISGATGNKPTVSKALATGDSTSAQTFGMCQTDIPNNSNGNVVCFGDLSGLNTSAFTEGAQLYLSSTTAGEYTTTKQLAPAHLVYIGVVTRAHPTLGQIEVRIQNGYELDEIHDVAISSLANNQGLFYESATDLWKNKTIATVLGYTPEPAVTAGTTAQYYRGDKTFQTLNTTAVAEGTNLYYTEGRVSANTDVAANTAARHNAVTLGTANGLSLSTQALSLGLASASANGALSSTDWTTFNNKQNALTNPVTGTGTTNYLAKFTGASTVGNSLIFDNGTKVGIGTSFIPTSRFLAVSGSAQFNGAALMEGANFSIIPAANGQDGVILNVGYDTGTDYGSLFINTGGNTSMTLTKNGAVTFAGSATATSFVKSGGTSSQYLMADGSVSTLSNPVAGTGTTNYLPKFTGSSSIGSSQISDDGELITLNVGKTARRTRIWNDVFVYNTVNYTDSDYAVQGRIIGASNGLLFHTNGTILALTLNSEQKAIFASSVTATSFIKSGGTSSQFLKADGSVDSSTYATTSALGNYVPLAGGTMTGRLFIDGSSFSGNADSLYVTNIRGGGFPLRVTATQGDYQGVLFEHTNGLGSGGPGPNGAYGFKFDDQRNNNYSSHVHPASFIVQRSGAYAQTDIFAVVDSSNQKGLAVQTSGIVSMYNGLLIGTTTDSGYKLDVNGTGRFNLVRTNYIDIPSGTGYNAFQMGSDTSSGGWYVYDSTNSSYRFKIANNGTATFTSYLVVSGGARVYNTLTFGGGLRELECAVAGGVAFYANEINANAQGVDGSLYFGWRGTNNLNFGVASTFSSTIRTTGLAIGVAPTANVLVVRGENSGYDGSITIGARSSIQHFDAGNTTLSICNDYDNNGAKMEFRMKGNTSANSVMTLLGNGNIGIGTTSPAYRLQSESGGVASYFKGGNGGYAAVAFSGDNNTTIGVLTTYDSGIYFGRANGAYNTQFGANYDIFIVGSNGNVLINKYIDAGFKLDVNGNTAVRGNLTLAGGSRYILGDGGDLFIDTENVSGRDILLQTVSGQNVGIGTTTVPGKLTAKYTSYSSGQTPLYIGNTGYSAWNRQSYDTFVLQQDDVTSFRMVEKNGEATGSDQVLSFSIGDGTASIATSAQPLSFYVNGSPSGLAYQGLSGTQVLRLNTNGSANFFGSLNVDSNITTSGSITSTVNGTSEIRLRGGGYGGSYNTSLRSIAGATGILQFGNNGSNVVLIGNTGTGGWLDFRTNCNSESVTAGSLALRLNSNATAEFYSSVTATSFFESSDATIKTLITDDYQSKGIESVVAKLYVKNGKEELGYYAQDVQGILPSAVIKGENGLLSLSYREVHTAKIARLEKRVSELEQQLNLN